MGPDLADSHQRAIREKNRGSCQMRIARNKIGGAANICSTPNGINLG